MKLAIQVLNKLGRKVYSHNKDHDENYTILPYVNGREKGLGILKYNIDGKGWEDDKVVVFSQTRNGDSLQVMVGKLKEFHREWNSLLTSGNEFTYKNTKYFESKDTFTKGVKFIKKELGL